MSNTDFMDLGERIAAAIEAACPDPDTPHVGDHCDYRAAARIARRIAAETANQGSSR